MVDAPPETTVIGPFPKPEYLPIEDWFDAARNLAGMGTPLVTERFTTYQQNRSSDDAALFVRAAKEVIDLQVNAGIVIPTDGEVRRENYIHYHCRHLDGFFLKTLSIVSFEMGLARPIFLRSGGLLNMRVGAMQPMITLRARMFHQPQ